MSFRGYDAAPGELQGVPDYELCNRFIDLYKNHKHRIYKKCILISGFSVLGEDRDKIISDRLEKLSEKISRECMGLLLDLMGSGLLFLLTDKCDEEKFYESTLYLSSDDWNPGLISKELDIEYVNWCFSKAINLIKMCGLNCYSSIGEKHNLRLDTTPPFAYALTGIASIKDIIYDPSIFWRSQEEYKNDKS